MHNPTPRAAAAQLHRVLSSGGSLTPVQAPVRVEAGEHAMAFWNQGFLVQRRRSLPAVRGCDTPRVLVGTPQFLLGYTVGSIASAMRRPRPSSTWSAPTPAPVILTSWRLIYSAPRARWIAFDHRHITSVELTRGAVTVTYTDAAPLHLAGPWAAWVATYLCHTVYGSETAARLPQLAALNDAPPSRHASATRT